MLSHEQALLEELATRAEVIDHKFDGVLFNGAVRPEALGLVRCRDASHVSALVQLAAKHGVPIAVLCGGHDLSGRAFARGNLVLDIRDLSSVIVDRENMTVTVGGGTLTGELMDQLPPDLVTPGGTVSSVGVAGLALAGGYGRLTSTLGLASDCLEQAEIVLADGSLALASETDDPELLWALRGGGSGFGVVTSLRLRLHHLPEILTGMVIYPLEEAKNVLLFCQELIDRHPSELNLFMGFMTGPASQPVLFVSPTWTGERAVGEKLLEELHAWNLALTIQRGWVSYKDTFDEEAEKAWPKGRNYNLPTQSVHRLNEDNISALIEGARSFTSPFSALVIHDFHGRPTEVEPDATAFHLRLPHFVIEIIAAWDGSSKDAEAVHFAWSQTVSDRLGAIAIPGGYPNLLSPGEAGRARLFYGQSCARLQAIKMRVDPHDLFRSAVGRLLD
jgi:FAD/FMN-containing dehydrogenase